MKDTINYYLTEIIEDVERRLSTVKEVLDWNSFSTKLKSELISSMWETSFSYIVPNTISPKLDSEPDLYLESQPLELKTSKTTTTWRGGEFSKRESNYLLIAWNENEYGMFDWFVCYTYLTEDDWKSSQSNNYYATTIDIGDVLKLPKTEILKGKTQVKRIKEHVIFND